MSDDAQQGNTKTAKNAPMIYAAMLEVQANVGAIGKDRQNQQQRFNFRSIDDAYNALHPVLVKAGVFAVPEVLFHHVEHTKTSSDKPQVEITALVQYTFYAEDGSSIKSSTLGFAVDMSDKAANKAMAFAHKYALLQCFSIPTQEQQDGDFDNPEIGAPSPPKNDYAGELDASKRALMHKHGTPACLAAITKTLGKTTIDTLDELLLVQQALEDAA